MSFISIDICESRAHKPMQEFERAEERGIIIYKCALYLIRVGIVLEKFADSVILFKDQTGDL